MQMGVVNRDIKLENTLLNGDRRPLLKICDFGYSKNEKDSLPKSKVGTPGYTGGHTCAIDVLEGPKFESLSYRWIPYVPSLALQSSQMRLNGFIIMCSARNTGEQPVI